MRALAAATRAGTFELEGSEYRYFFHVYNKTWTNERTVEIPVAWRFVRDCACRTLEIGNVLSHYFAVRHDIVDKYERAPGVINEDVAVFTPSRPYDAIVSVSTLEHVGWHEEPRDESKVEAVIARLRELLTPGGRALVTVPLGQNPHLDRLIRERRSGFDSTRFMMRTSESNRWKQVEMEQLEGVRYGHPYPWANGLMIGMLESGRTAG